MSVSSDLMERFPGLISTIRVNKNGDLHGQHATEVTVDLMSGKRVEGVFTSESRPGFGGVVFSSNKDVVGLMSAKINSVLEGTYEEG